MQDIDTDRVACEHTFSKNSEPSRIMDQAERLLIQHPHFRSGRSDIRLESDGKTLTISGRVPTYFRKQLLQEAFRSIEPIQRIDNQVIVFPVPLHDG